MEMVQIQLFSEDEAVIYTENVKELLKLDF